MKMAESSPKKKKTLWEKEKLLVTSNFSFFHSVFKRFLLQTSKIKGLFWKGLKKNVNNIKVPQKHFDFLTSFPRRRALLGINMRKEFYNVEIPQLGDQKLACESLEPLDPRDQEYSPVQIWNLKYEQVNTA